MAAVAVLWAAAVFLTLRPGSSSPPGFVDLSSRNLSSVPSDLPPTAEVLDLSQNHIRELQAGDFNRTRLLRVLNVSWNLLEDISPETFLHTPLLQNLDLSHNRLKNLSEQRYLRHTPGLLVLDLSHNHFLSMALGPEFTSLWKLEGLTVGASNVSLGDFINISKLKLHNLTISLEEEVGYEAGSLQDVDAQRLQIDFNKKPTLDQDLVSDALSKFSEVELLHMTSGYRELGAVLKQRAKVLTSRLSLSHLGILWADLTQLLNTVLTTSIRQLQASDVAIYSPPYLDTKVNPTSNMKSFVARRAEVKSFFFSQEALYNFFINLPVETLVITESSLIHMTCPKSQSRIQHLDFSSCAISDSIFSTVSYREIVECENLGNLKKLVLVDNNFKNLQVLSRRLHHMRSLQHLDLSLNSIVYDGSSECQWPPNITQLNLSSNSLTGSVFKCLPAAVESLDLQNNQISEVPETIADLQNLVSLNLNSNRLRDLPACHHLPVLSLLLLRANSLHAPSVSKMENCSKLQTLDVSHNPFTCTCALRGFMGISSTSEQDRDSNIKLLDWPVGYYCIYPEGVRNSLLTQIWIPEISCSPGLLAASILVPAVVLIVSVVTLCHRLDGGWYLKMIYRWTRAKHRARRRQAEDLVGVEFHGFVSYSQHDAHWVHNSLLPNLEGPAGGLRICHHETHFLPGKTIVENIISCVEKSRRSLFVLSAHFVQSEWCHYELYFASHQRLSRGPDAVVLLLLEPLPLYLIPDKHYQLRAMMRRHTYLEWPQDRAKQRLFWANLRAALQGELPGRGGTDPQE